MPTTFQFDDSTITIKHADPHWGKQYEVQITEGAHKLELLTDDGGDLVVNAAAMTRAVNSMSAWVADRIVFCAELARRRLASPESGV